MKKIMMILMVMLMSMTASMPASASTGKNEVKNAIPENLVVKQTTYFNDGRTLTIYYKKQGFHCEVYSPCDTKQYDMSDAAKIKSTNFEVVEKVEGKLYRKGTIGEMMRLVKRYANNYLQ